MPTLSLLQVKLFVSLHGSHPSFQPESLEPLLPSEFHWSLELNCLSCFSLPNNMLPPILPEEHSLCLHATAAAIVRVLRSVSWIFEPVPEVD
jgi:hypothetical protein